MLAMNLKYFLAFLTLSVLTGMPAFATCPAGTTAIKQDTMERDFILGNWEGEKPQKCIREKNLLKCPTFTLKSAGSGSTYVLSKQGDWIFFSLTQLANISREKAWGHNGSRRIKTFYDPKINSSIRQQTQSYRYGNSVSPRYIQRVSVWQEITPCRGVSF